MGLCPRTIQAEATPDDAMVAGNDTRQRREAAPEMGIGRPKMPAAHTGPDGRLMAENRNRARAPAEPWGQRAAGPSARRVS